MWLDVRPKRRHRGRPSPAFTGSETIGMDLAPYPRGVSDPWRNRVQCHLWWHMSGGVICAIATAKLTGVKVPDPAFRVQQVATLNTYRDRCPIMYMEGQRSIVRSDVDSDWAYGVEFGDERVRQTVEVAAQACHLELRERMREWAPRGFHEEVDIGQDERNS